jgi:hypothetical protein
MRVVRIRFRDAFALVTVFDVACLALLFGRIRTLVSAWHRRFSKLQFGFQGVSTPRANSPRVCVRAELAFAGKPTTDFAAL